MRQIVNEIIHRDPISQRRPLLRITPVVRPFPRIAQIHVVADRDHHAPLVVVNRAPVRSLSCLPCFPCPAAARPLPAGDLEAIVQIVNRMEDLVRVRDVLDRAVRKNPASCSRQTHAIRSEHYGTVRRRENRPPSGSRRAAETRAIGPPDCPAAPSAPPPPRTSSASCKRRRCHRDPPPAPPIASRFASAACTPSSKWRSERG